MTADTGISLLQARYIPSATICISLLQTLAYYDLKFRYIAAVGMNILLHQILASHNYRVRCTTTADIGILRLQIQAYHDYKHRYISLTNIGISQSQVSVYVQHWSHSNNNTSSMSTWSISMTKASPMSLKTELYSGKHNEQVYLFFLVDTRLSWLLQ